MFTITKQFIGGEIRHAVAGEVGASVITVLATSEMQACEIARCLNEAAGVNVEDLVEIANAADLHSAMESIVCREDRRDHDREMAAARARDEAADLARARAGFDRERFDLQR